MGGVQGVWVGELEQQYGEIHVIKSNRSHSKILRSKRNVVPFCLPFIFFALWARLVISHM